MMGNQSLSFIIISILLISLIIKHHVAAFTSGKVSDIKRHRVKRNSHTDFGAFDLHLKSGRTSKVWDGYRQGQAEGLGGQVQGLDNTGSSEKLHPFYKNEGGSRSRENMERHLGRSGGIVKIGCVSTWEGQYTQFLSAAGEVYNDEYTHVSCINRCRRASLQIAMLRGSECQCSHVSLFNSTRVPEHFCHVPCPIKAYEPETAQTEMPEYPCGGNMVYSVYCSADGTNDCRSITEIYEGNLVSMSLTEPKAFVPVLNDPCTVCASTDGHCFKKFLRPDFDYFPTNSPKRCVQFCSRNVTFIRGSSGEEVRQATPYARLAWLRKLGAELSICSCVEEEDRSKFQSVEDHSLCRTPCPGANSETCGGRQSADLQKVYSTFYCVPGVRGCEQWRPPSTTTTPSTTVSTTPTSPSTPFDPCKDGLVDCDHGQPDTTETTTTTKSTVTETTEDVDNTTTQSHNSTEIITTTIAGATASTIPPLTSSKPCSIKCKAKDRYGHFWEVCAPSQGITPCSELISDSEGQAFWTCTAKGRFQTRNPDVCNCSSAWIQDQEKALEEINNFDEADEFMTNLYTRTRNSSKEYFGHEIRSLTEFVDRVLDKSREYFPPFTDFESMIRTAIEMNSYLFQHYEPWKDLQYQDKSSISTDLLENTEAALFHLTDAVESEDYVQIFSMINETDIYRFLILAETFDKMKNNMAKSSYEFPPRNTRELGDSFIKLPKGWGELLPDDKVNIAAMSIDPDYVSYTMPGQYDNTNLSGNDDNSKLINGKMISLSLTSGWDDVNVKETGQVPTQRMTFSKKGAEITFYHDIEAWGKEKFSVHRKLHMGEKPRAVLGSTQCVYWDTAKHVWLSKGCRIIRSNRYETVCECSHLTSFAVLMDVHQYVGKQLALEMLTLVLCPISEVALVLSIIILSSVNGLQRIRATITTNLSACLLVGNGMVLFVLDRNYFNMSEGVCIGSAMITHYIFLCAFMWMLIEGVQLYRMVVHVFDSGRSYIKHFGILAYGLPLIIIAITATTGYLKGDKPYGGDVYCWLEGSYIWSFMGPVALVIMVNMIILFIALKTAYQLQQTKKLSPTFLMGRIRSCKTWFKGCFSLTVILGLTWAVGFFTLVGGSGGVIAAYLFTILNASQGLFIFLFNCVLNEKVRSFTQRNLSTYLPSWLTSSDGSNPEDNGNDTSVYGKRERSLNDKLKRRLPRQQTAPIEARNPYIISNSVPEYNDVTDIPPPNGRRRSTSRGLLKGPKVDFVDDRKRNDTEIVQSVKRSESVGTISSGDSIPASSASDNGHISSDTSQSALISKIRVKEF